MKANALRAAVLFAAAALAACAVAAACNLTDGLTGGAPEIADAAPGGPCDADLAHSNENCGACGHACTAGPNGLAVCVDGGCAIACTAPFADCDDASATGCETNLNASKTSCGRCGHDCLGGACTTGVCQPLLLWAGADTPSQIVTSDTHVYGINAFGTVSRIPKDGGTLVPLVAGRDTAQAPPPQIAIANGSLYYTSMTLDGGADGGVYAQALDGGRPVLMAPSDDPLAIIAGPTYVTWTEGNGEGPAPTTGVKRCKVASCESTIETPVPRESGTIYSIAIDGANNLYWANAGTAPTWPESEVAMCKLPACTPVTLATTPSQPFDLVLDKTTVYWTTLSGTVSSCSIPLGCTEQPTKLDTFQYRPGFLAASGALLFWTNRDGTIKSIPKVPPTPPAPPAERIVYQLRGAWPWAIVVEADALYWTDLAGSGGQPGTALFKLAR